MKILVIGSFDFVTFDSGGQPVKTRELYYALQNKYGEESLSYFETQGRKQSRIMGLLRLISMLRASDVVIMLPAVNGVRYLTPILTLFKKKSTKLFYSVIGGWLPKELKSKPTLATLLKKFDGLWVETTSMERNLMDMGFNNVVTVKNFKQLNIVKEEDLKMSFSYPLRLCTFSRVLEKKGIGDAIKAVKNVNEKKGINVLSLDIYGPIDEGYEAEFKELQKSFPDYISYKGEKKPNESVEAIKDYFALLFPTKFYTEGIPGTIIDAYSAGVPVVSSLWLNVADVFIDGYTGLGYPFGDYDKFEEVLKLIADEPMRIVNLKKNCLEMAKKYTPEAVIKKISSLIES